MRWKRYPAYKDSGVEWLGEVPEHWDEYSLRWCVEEINTNVEADDMLYIGLEHIESWTGKVHSVDQVSEVISGKHFLPGDVLFGRLRPYLAKGFVADEEGICSGELLVLRPNGMNRFYLHFLLLSPGFVGCVDSSTYGAKMPRVSWEFIRKLVIPVPGIGEQERIASFIEVQTCGIDTLISKKQRQLELLEERRTALITNAVSKGLDPNVKMKDSGVEWLGKVPEHWVVTCLGRFARVKSGEFISNEETSGEKQPPHVYPVIGGNGIMGYCADYNEECPLIVVGRVGALCGNVHLLDERVWVTDNALILHDMRGFRLDYLTYFLQMAQLNQYASQTAQPLITGSMLKAHRVVLPPFEEQRSIVSFLECQTACIDALRDKIQQSIDTLQEYRSALISAAVTGQIDVREEVV